MKHILITGLNGYIGNHLTEWISKTRPSMVIQRLSLKDDEWMKIDFSKFDVVVHLAGIAHQRETNQNKQLYYEINRDLTLKVANKAKEDGVAHFIFISSMSVFGQNRGIIDGKTTLNPGSHYGKSKHEAELGLQEMINSEFIVSIVRPPMVYGFESTGNYSKLSSLIRKLSFFPDVSNQRSMISIQNLNEFISLLVEHPQNGYFHPQNREYISTKELVIEIARNNCKKIFLIPDVLGIFKQLSLRSQVFGKILGDLVYSHEMSELRNERGEILEYNVINFVDSIEEAENER